MDKLSPLRLDFSWLSRALLLSQEAGWNQTADDWAVFFAHGTVLGIAHGDRLVATSAVLPYGADFAWLSMVLVTADWRRRGLATRLASACVSFLRDNGKAALLDAAPDAAASTQRGDVDCVLGRRGVRSNVEGAGDVVHGHSPLRRSSSRGASPSSIPVRPSVRYSMPLPLDALVSGRLPYRPPASW